MNPFSLTNIRCFIAFRIFFNCRFYYPVFTVLFLDMGLSLEQFYLLNAAWAATIVLMEVPSGAFADTFGRRNLLVAATVCMVIEMLVISFTPLSSNTLVFYALLVNRIISGAAEALASGADEALAYDTLKSANKEKKWPKVLERLMMIQSIAFIVAMVTGALVYDADLMSRFFYGLGWEIEIASETSLRFPIYLNLITAFLALFVTLRMKEVSVNEAEKKQAPGIKEAFSLTWKVGHWIMRTPIVWALILIALFYESIIRMFLTLNSNYYRLIEIPEAAFGVMGALMSIVSLGVPVVARRLVEKRSIRFNFIFIGIGVLIGLIGLALVLPWWGIVPALVLGAGIYFLGFFMSHYLNKVVDSEHRATVLSFRGLACNLSYGLLGIVYWGATKLYRIHLEDSSFTGGEELMKTTIFTETLFWMPIYFAGVLIGLFLLLKNRLYEPAPLNEKLES